MPVKFRGSSEYRREFETASKKIHNLQVTAGKTSQQTANFNEPPIQHKKRSSTDQVKSIRESADDSFHNDYILLGDQSKFTNNIIYKPVAPKKQKKSKENEASVANGVSNNEVINSPPPAPRPAPKIIVDTGARPAKDRKEANDNRLKIQSSPSKNNETHATDKISTSSQQMTKDKNKNLSRPHQKNGHGGVKKSNNDNISHSNTVSKRPVKPNQGRNTTKEWTSSGERRSQSQDRSDILNKQISKTVNKSLQPVQDNSNDYAMKHRAGIAVPKFTGPKRRSEYQVQFDWKNRVNSSPLVAAENMIYSSDVQLPPSHSRPLASVTEYKQEFQPWISAEREGRERAKDPDQTLPKTKTNVTKPKDKKKRSKSCEPPAQSLKDNEKPKRVSQKDRALLKTSQNPQPPFFPHGVRKSTKNSEYANNFRPPWRYSYENGSWKGASLPHHNIKDVSVDCRDESRAPVSSANSATSWYQEVLELRSRAAEYRRRAHGTHFSREHLAQLYARQAQLWDSVSNSSSLSALALEPSAISNENAEPAADSVSLTSARSTVLSQPISVITDTTQASTLSKVTDSTVLTHDENSHRSLEPAAKPRKKAWSEQRINLQDSQVQTEDEPSFQNSEAQTDLVIPDDQSDHSTLVGLKVRPGSKSTKPRADEVGRLPTPTLSRADSSLHHRHHLDVTTPALGGAILVSPPLPSNRGSSRSSVSTQVDGVDQVVHPTKKATNKGLSHTVKPSQSTTNQTREKLVQTLSSNQAQIKTRPTYGLPTPDTHTLLDDSASIDRPLFTKYVGSPLQSQTEINNGGQKSISTSETKTNHRFDAPPPLNLGEEVPGLAAVSPGSVPPDDDDAVSVVSARSLASSCSLASEVLERARQRRDEFWGARNALQQRGK